MFDFSCLSFILSACEEKFSSSSLLRMEDDANDYYMRRDGKGNESSSLYFSGGEARQWQSVQFTCGGFNLESGNYWNRTWLCHRGLRCANICPSVSAVCTFNYFPYLRMRKSCPNNKLSILPFQLAFVLLKSSTLTQTFTFVGKKRFFCVDHNALDSILFEGIVAGGLFCILFRAPEGLAVKFYLCEVQLSRWMLEIFWEKCQNIRKLIWGWFACVEKIFHFCYMFKKIKLKNMKFLNEFY